ncbi:MAG: NAD(P)-dependent alcohol dehydrogenase [Candidatus Heimdallarchaeota archaeon]|nr:NAD(P)-dependent alcohol dehydrogenase [Candidatus Heimdallarchaeota archaeon]
MVYLKNVDLNNYDITMINMEPEKQSSQMVEYNIDQRAILKMKAMVYEKFGTPDVFELREMQRPEISADEILIKTYASSVNTIDIVFRSGQKAVFGLARLTTGIRKPKYQILGFDFAGEVIECGQNVTGYSIGDRVYGGPGGIGDKVYGGSGGYAEFLVVDPKNISKMASNMRYAEAASVPMAALSALQGLRDSGNIKEGQEVLIYGASGGIGTFAVQLAKVFGTKVTAVSSGKNKELVRSLGADGFFDYTKEDYTKHDKKYDLILDAVGKLPFSMWKGGLKQNGIFVNAGNPKMSITRFILSLLGNKFRKKKYRNFDVTYNSEDLQYLAKLSEEEKIRSVVEKSYDLKDLAEAHRYYERGRTAGKVAVIIANE